MHVNACALLLVYMLHQNQLHASYTFIVRIQLLVHVVRVMVLLRVRGCQKRTTLLLIGHVVIMHVAM